MLTLLCSVCHKLASKLVNGQCVYPHTKSIPISLSLTHTRSLSLSLCRHMMADIPGEPDVKGHNIPTYTNSAYYTVKHRQEGGGGGEEVTGDSVSVVEETHYALIGPAPKSAVSPAPLSPHEYEIPVATDDPPPTAAHNPLATPNYANVGMAARASSAEAVEEAVYAHISEEK